MLRIRNLSLTTSLLTVCLLASGCTIPKATSLKPFMASKFNNTNTKESPRWEEFIESMTDANSMTWEKKGIKREDGFTLIREKVTVENKLETFICRGNFTEFSFFASRWDSHNEKPSDIYTVWVNGTSGDWYIDKETHMKLVLSQAKDIEAALRAFPLNKIMNIPIKEVVFNIATNPKVPQLVHAEEAAQRLSNIVR